MATKKAVSPNQPVVGMIGLGIMGGMMAETLLEAGYQVTGYDVTPAARARLRRAGGKPLNSIVTDRRNKRAAIGSTCVTSP